jgi:hypothetical protein
MQRAIPTNPNGNKTTFKTFLDKYKTHSKLNTKPRRGAPDTYLEMIMNVLEVNKRKFKDGDYNYLMGELGRLQGGFLESVYPVGEQIVNGLKFK